MKFSSAEIYYYFCCFENTFHTECEYAITHCVTIPFETFTLRSMSLKLNNISAIVFIKNDYFFYEFIKTKFRDFPCTTA